MSHVVLVFTTRRSTELNDIDSCRHCVQAANMTAKTALVHPRCLAFNHRSSLRHDGEIFRAFKGSQGRQQIVFLATNPLTADRTNFQAPSPALRSSVNLQPSTMDPSAIRLLNERCLEVLEWQIH